MANKESNYSINVQLNGIDTAISTVGQLEEALITTKIELKNLEVGSEEFEKMSAQARILQREIQDVYKEGVHFDKNLAQIGESVTRLGSSVTSAFTIASSAMSLFGAESEDLSKAQIKAQQTLALALSATTLATNAAKLSQDLKNISDALGLNLTTQKTTATVGSTVATEGQTVATGAATVAQNTLNASMLANPIVLIIAGLTALVAALYIFSGAEEDVAKDVTTANEALKNQNNLIETQTGILEQLAKARGDKRASEAKSDAERARIADETEKEITKIQLEGLTEQKENLEKTLTDQKELLEEYGTVVVNGADKNNKKLTLGERIKLREKIDLLAEERDATIAQQEEALKRDPAKANEVNTKIKFAQIEFYKDLIDLRLQFVDKNDEAAVKELEQLKKLYTDDASNLEKLTGKINALNETTYDAVKDLNRKKAEERKKDQDEGYKSVYDYLQRLSSIELKNIEDMGNLKKKTDVEKNKEERDRQVSALQEEYTAFVANNDKKIKSGAITAQQLKMINDQLNANIRSANELEVAKNEQNAKDKIEKQQIENAKILELQEILKVEIQANDNNTLDTFTALAIRKQQIIKDNISFELTNENLNAKEKAKLREQELVEIKKLNDMSQEEEIKQSKLQVEFKTKSLHDSLKADGELTLTEAEYLSKTELNLKEEQKTKELEINEKYRKINAKAEEDVRESSKEANEAYFNEQLASVNRYASAASAVTAAYVSNLSTISQQQTQNDIDQIQIASNARVDALTSDYNYAVETQKRQYESGVTTEAEYRDALSSLRDNYNESTKKAQQAVAKQELEVKRKAFEQEKSLRIASTIMTGISAALSAFASAQVLPFPASAIVGGVLAAGVGVMTGIQVSNIKKQQFNGGTSVDAVTAPSVPSSSGEDSTTSTVQNKLPTGSSGGYTQFNPNLITDPVDGAHKGGKPSGDDDGGRYRVSVQEINEVQKRVKVYEEGSTFG